MKAQGLPINFIVLAALAILILILAAGFVIAGGSSAGRALSPTDVKNSCNNACLTLKNMASVNDSDTAGSSGSIIQINSPYCKNYTVTGIGTINDCTDSKIGTPCVVTFGNGVSCTVKCTGTNATC